MKISLASNTSTGKQGISVGRTKGSGSYTTAATHRSKPDIELASALSDIGVMNRESPQPSNDAKPANFMVSYGLAHNTLFQGILPQDEASMIPYYRDIHDFDNVGGSAVDITASFPWSNYQLVGLEAKELVVFKEAMSRLNIRALMTDASTDLLVDGAWIATPIFSRELDGYCDLATHDRMDCTIGRKPTYSVDPAIKLNNSGGLSDFYSRSPFADDIYQYASGLIDVFRSGGVTLDPATTIYVPRATNKNHPTVSYLRRMLPIYIYEKLVYRASLIETSKRMRSTTHIQVGSENWIASGPEMTNILEQFQLSELDPMGGWVVTRDGVNVGEVRNHADALQWRDIADQLIPAKLRSLGVSEAFLSRDANFSNSTTALAVFMESIGALREYITFRVFTNKLFPMIALQRGMVRDAKKLMPMTSMSGILANLSDYTNLKIPKLHWNKPMRNADSSTLDILGTAAEKGLPIPLQMWAAAADLDVGVMLGGLETDVEIYEEIKRITGKDPRDKQDEPTGDADGGEGGGEWASRDGKGNAKSRGTSSYSKVLQKKPLLSREFGSLSNNDMALGKSGKPVRMSPGDVINRQNDLHRAAKQLQDPHYFRSVISTLKSNGHFTNPLM